MQVTRPNPLAYYGNTVTDFKKNLKIMAVPEKHKNFIESLGIIYEAYGTLPHQHILSAQVRKYTETQIIKLARGRSVFEIGCSGRTLDWSLENWFYNRCIVPGTLCAEADLGKLMKMYNLVTNTDKLNYQQTCTCYQA